MSELQTLVDPASDTTAVDRIICEGIGEETPEGDWKDVALAFVESVLNGESDNKGKFMSPHATHLDVQILDLSQVVMLVYYKYFDLEPLGPIIGGNLVVEGTVAVNTHGPALCTVEYAADEDETFTVVDTICPWSMMVTTAPTVDEGSSFAIPIKVPDTCREGSLRVRVYAAPLEKIPLDEADKESCQYEPTPSAFQCAVEFIKSTKEVDQAEYIAEEGKDSGEGEVDDGEGEGDKDLDAAYAEERSRAGSRSAGMSERAEAELANAMMQEDRVVVKSLHVMLDIDELDHLHSLGHELHTMEFTEEGVKEDIPHSWRFYLVAEMGMASEGGLEDVRFVSAPKAVGALPPTLEGYEVLHDDLTDQDDKKSVYLAMKIGLNPKFKRLVMVTAPDECEETFNDFSNNCQDMCMKAPKEVCSVFQGTLAVLLEYLDPQTNDLNLGEVGFEDSQQVGDSESPDTLEDEEADMFMRSFEENSVQAMHDRIAELEAQRDALKEQHADIQRKAAAVFARDKAQLGVVPGKSSEAANASSGNDQNDTEAEREKHFVEVLQQVSDCRKKLYRQQQEFDQLAHDLQTRLDDKEYKASEITISFQEFKREIMSKAQNSRTGKPISKRLMEQYETAEQKKDSDLEKVRLRNISLRTSLRKLERQLRAREQLAEGLHMIDFEQLKIENQTLNEKIEERNEELAKLKRKKTSTVQVLTHIREKLKFVENQNEIVRSNLGDIEHLIMGQRSILTSAKHDRDFVRDDNAELKRKQGFATNDLLLVDFEKRKSQMESVREEIKELQERYSILSTQLNGLTQMKSQSADRTSRK